MPTSSLVAAVVSLALGVLFGWLLATWKARASSSAGFEALTRKKNDAETYAARQEAAVDELRRSHDRAMAELTQLRERGSAIEQARVRAEAERDAALDRAAAERQLLAEARTHLTDAFKALAGDTLTATTNQFLALARETLEKTMTDARGELGQRQEAIQGVLKPLSETITRFDEQVRGLEKSRVEAYGALADQVKSLSASNHRLESETAKLVTALRKPQVRGRWGEMTLRRVVELAGLSDHCDFSEQVSTETDNGRLRPDLIVHLPAGRDIVVDAKVPLEAYLDATNAESDAERKDAMARHAAQTRKHMDALADKQYWAEFESAPEFVVMFIPGESFFGAAVDVDHDLIENGLERGVVIATPTTLIALLRAVAYGWRQESLAKNAKEISELGRELYERMGTLAGHVNDIGKGLEKANGAYNHAVGSFERRVLVSARRFRDLGAATGEELPAVEPVEVTPRMLAAPSDGPTIL